MRATQLFFFAWMCALAAVPSAAVDLIANKNVSVQRLTLASARAIFGMRQVKWPDGSLVKVIVLPDTHPLHGAMCKERLNMYSYQLQQSRDRLVYSGMAQAPIEVASEAEMVSVVASTPGAIGYVGKHNNYPSVRVLHVE